MKKSFLFYFSRLGLFFYLIFLFCLANVVFADTSNISKIAFTTGEQTIKPNEVSKEITIQIQDSYGNKVVALETIRFDAFQSTSPTGAFVSCTTPTNPPTDYISKNNSNKNICYKDSTEGVYTITARTNNTVSPLVASQKITISSLTVPTGGTSDSGNSTTTASSTATTTATTTSQTSDTTSSGGWYVYSSSAPLSTYDPVSLNVDAGRERIAFLHSPIEFKSRAVDKNSGKDVFGARYVWSFGDGTSAEGSVVSHTYAFPGDYVVVLNSSSGIDDAVDLTNIKVIEPKVSLISTDSYLEISNEKDLDVNIGGWKIKGDSKEYVIPRDTIISSKNNIKIPRQILGEIISSKNISLLYPDQVVSSQIASIGEVEKQKQIAKEFNTKLLALKTKLDQIDLDSRNVTYLGFAEQKDSGISTK